MSIPGCGVRMATLLWSGANRPTHTLETAARRTRRTPNYLEKRANTKDHCRCSLLYLPASPNRFVVLTPTGRGRTNASPLTYALRHPDAVTCQQNVVGL